MRESVDEVAQVSVEAAVAMVVDTAEVAVDFAEVGAVGAAAVVVVRIAGV